MCQNSWNTCASDPVQVRFLHGGSAGPSKVYTLVYTELVVPEVLSVRELRAGLASVIERVQRGAAVFVGAHRRAEAVLVSVEQYEALVRAARQREAVAEALASVRAEGLEPTLDGLELLERLATGEVGEDEAIEALRRLHQR